ncbi:hypothetical protein L2E82_10964 [Cichorium intybus]|uniref:Uncharacterized protein n=1 Tax=Cichorium intybus TaxID=13427 RepID=A0ACB9GBV0_CICIN|nr:hypothetical protein L2E82_10964 [Cichorium intybus]
MVNLKHLFSNTELYLPSIGKPMKLEFISNVVLGDGVDNFQKCFPRIKKLTTTLYLDEENDFEELLYLETLVLIGSGSRRRESTEPEFLRGEPNLGKILIGFPAALKQLAIRRCHLPWSNMSIIQSLPNLVALEIRHNGFEGTLWETGEKQFQQLKFLGLFDLNIKQWETSSLNFPRLEQLKVGGCVDLEEIPLELGDIPTLQTIEVSDCAPSLRLSVLKIQKEQYDVGNCELKIIVDEVEMPSFAPTYDD